MGVFSAFVGDDATFGAIGRFLGYCGASVIGCAVIAPNIYRVLILRLSQMGCD